MVCGRLTIYRGEMEEYKPLITPEAVYIVTEYCKIRREYGEELSLDSPMVRNVMTVEAKMNSGYSQTKKKEVAPLGPNGIRMEMNYLYYKYGIRKKLVEPHRGRHEFKLIHGWRKFADTVFKQHMKWDMAEYQLGHLTHYFRPELSDHIEEFKKVIPHLSLDKAKNLELQLQNRDKEYYEKIRGEVTLELESEFLTKYKDEIRKIALSAIQEKD